MKTNFIFLIISLACLCSSCKKTYVYTAQYLKQGIMGGTTMEEEKKTIRATNDSVAYYEAYMEFYIRKQADQQIIEQLGETYKKVISFSIENTNGEDLVNLLRPSVIEACQHNVEILMSGCLEEANPIKEAAIDSAKIKELLPYFTFSKDEFSTTGKTWIEPKSKPKYVNRNGICCYFMQENAKVSNFRFRIQYYAEDWLFFHTVQFSIDGQAYEYVPSNTETDCGDGGMIWEWFDEGISYSKDVELIKALANAKEAKMKLIGRQYHTIKTISKQQISDIKRTVELYEAMGGIL